MLANAAVLDLHLAAEGVPVPWPLTPSYPGFSLVRVLQCPQESG